MIEPPPRPARSRWPRRVVAALALVVVGWVAATSWPALVHGHPAYPVLLGLTVIGALAALQLRRRPRRRVLSWLSLLLGLGWVALIAWLRPFPAVDPAPAAMVSDDAVTVTESATSYRLRPTGSTSETALFFQPGALVDARAYAATLRPVAEAGTLVVVAKQPLGIGFLALGAFDSARAANPQVTDWVVAGHSLGGTVAATTAAAHDEDGVVGLVLWASYPASDLSADLTAAALSVSGSLDGLSTPAKIDDSRSLLPAGATFVVVDGASHASFGDYGPQPGDGTPTLPHDEARAAIAAATVDLLTTLP